MPRGIQQIHLFDNGIVVCYDAAFRQAPSLQGMFWDVRDNILKMFDEDSVQWVLIKGREKVVVSRSEWVVAGDGITHQPLPERRINDIRLSLSDL